MSSSGVIQIVLQCETVEEFGCASPLEVVVIIGNVWNSESIHLSFFVACVIVANSSTQKESTDKNKIWWAGLK